MFPIYHYINGTVIDEKYILSKNYFCSYTNEQKRAAAPDGHGTWCSETRQQRRDFNQQHVPNGRGHVIQEIKAEQ